MRKFLILTVGILCMASSAFAGGDIMDTDGEENGQFIDTQGLPRAQDPDIENRLVSKKAAVHAKSEAKKSELGVKDDVTLSSLGISEPKVIVVKDTVKPVNVQNAKTKDTQKTLEDDVEFLDEINDLEGGADKKVENDKEKMAKADEEAKKIEEDINEIENGTITDKEKTNKADEEVKAPEVDDEMADLISEEIDNTADIGDDKSAAKNDEDILPPAEADSDEKESKSAFDELDDMF